jgi:predicted ArsR family transcriptional regulator
VATISELASVLRLTGEAVRQQLLQLQRDGWVETRAASGKRHRTGRPASIFTLTTAGDHLFPKSYDELASNLLQALSSEVGSEHVLTRLADIRVAAAEPSIRPLPLAEKVDALKGLYRNDDSYMNIETTDDGYRLVERNCPYYNVAMANPAICSVSVDVLTRLLGVRVEREEKFQSGDGRCAFRIFSDQPAKH